MSYLLSPVSALSQINRELSRFFDDRQDGRAGLLDDSGWAPSVDITEDDAAFKVVADVPGVDPKDIDISLHQGLLTIRGERETSQQDEAGSFARRERFKGRFLRQFNLPDSADAETVSAKSVNGVLEVTIPKAKKALPITVKVEGD